jgi:hypothetical protein
MAKEKKEKVEEPRPTVTLGISEKEPEQFNAAGEFAGFPGLEDAPAPVDAPTDVVADETSTDGQASTDPSMSKDPVETTQEPTPEPPVATAEPIDVGGITREAYRRTASILEGSSFPPFNELEADTQQSYLDSAQSVIDGNPTRTTFEEQVREVLNG